MLNSVLFFAVSSVDYMQLLRSCNPYDHGSELRDKIIRLSVSGF